VEHFSEQERHEIYRCIHSGIEATFRRYPSEEHLFWFLRENPSGITSDELRSRFFERLDVDPNSVAIDSVLERLNELLDRHFEAHPLGQLSPYRIEAIHLSNQDVYRFKITKNRPPRTAPKAFLCHASTDKQEVRILYDKLLEKLIQPWLDERDLIPGQDWDAEIRKAVRATDVVLVCLSRSSITKEGYVQREIKIALDVADEKPEGMIYLIPIRLEECALPTRLAKWHCVDLFKSDGFDKLVRAIQVKTEQKGSHPA
jgi:TIR domain-containing protein